MSLDERLLDIWVDDSLNGTGVPLDEEAITKIKQAFISEGWLPVDNIATAYLEGKARAHGLMTGAEWETKALKEGWIAPPHLKVSKQEVEAFVNDPVKLVDDGSGKYWVTTSGEVYSTAWGKIKKKAFNYYHDGYARVSLSKGRTALVHRLVAKAWLPNPDDKVDVNHKDGNKANNHITNLEWNTRKENVAHAFRTGLIIRGKGTNASHSKLTEAAVKDILERLAKGETGTSLAKEYGVAHGRIYDIKNGRGWTHVTLEAAKRASGLGEK